MSVSLASEGGLAYEAARVDRAVLELYVALKSKPIAILCGPPDSGKLAAARALGAALTGKNAEGFQEMVGHAWWASRSPGVALFTEAQQRFNRDKFEAVLEEAAGCRTADRVLVVLLSRISPGEWGFLVELAALLRRGRILQRLCGKAARLPTTGSNIVLMVTFDTIERRPWPHELLESASILSWTPRDGAGSATRALSGRLLNEGTSFVQACLREPRAALRRLRSLPGWQDEMVRPLFRLLGDVSDANCAASEMLIYLANAWTWDGRPLLAPAFDDNLRLAKRLAVTLAVAPRAGDRLTFQAAAREGIGSVLRDRRTRMLPERLDSRTEWTGDITQGRR